MDVESLRAAVEAAPDDVKAFESLQNALIEEDRLSELEALYPTVFEAVRDTAAHDRMVRVVDQRARGTEDESLKNWLNMQLGVLFWQHLENPERAEVYFRRVQGEAKQQGIVGEFYEEFYVARDNWRRLEQLFVARGMDEASVKRKLAEIAESKGKQDKALSFWQAVYNANPDDGETYARLEKLYAEIGKWHSLVDLYKKRLKMIREDVEASVGVYLQMIDIYANSIKSDTNVISTWQQILKLQPDNLQALNALEQVYLRMNRWPDLARILQARLQVVEDDASKLALHQQIATLMLERFSNSSEAIKHLQAVLELAPEDLTALGQLKELYEQRKTWEKYVEVAQREISLTCENSEDRAAALIELAEIASERIRHPRIATGLWEEIRENDPHNLNALTQLERLYEREKAWEKLVTVLELRSELAADDDERLTLLDKLGVVLGTRIKDEARTAQVWRQLLGLDSTHRKAFNELRKRALNLQDWETLQWLFRTYGELADLVRTLESQLKTLESRDKVALLGTIVGLWTEQGETRRAVNALEQILELDAANAAAADQLIPIYQSLEEWDRLPPLYDVTLDAISDPAQRQAVLIEKAEVHEHRQADLEAAFFCFVQAYQEDLSNASIRAEFDRLAEASNNWEVYVSIIEQVIERGSGDTAALSELLLRAADVHHRFLAQPEQALAHYQRVLDSVDPANALALSQTEAIYRETGQWDELIDVLHAKLAGDSLAPEVEKALRFEIGAVWRDQLEEPEAAMGVYREMMERFPDDTRIYDELAHLHMQEESWDRLSEVFERKLTALADRADTTPGELADLRCKLGMLAYSHGNDINLAVMHYVDALQADAGCQQAVSNLVELISSEEHREEIAVALEPIYRAQEQHFELADVLEIQLSFASARKSRMAFLKELSDLYQNVLSDNARAFWSCSRLFELEPGKSELCRRLEALTAELGAWASLADLYEANVASVKSEKARLAIYRTVADVAQDHLSDDPRAERIYRVILDESPEHAPTLDAIEELYLRTDAPEKLLGVIRTKESLAEQDEARVELRLQLAAILADQLHRPPEAIEDLQVVLSLDAENAIALARLNDLYRQVQQWEDLRDILARRVDLATDEQSKAALMLELAALLEGPLDDVEGAIGEYALILDFNPTQAGTVAALERLFESAEYAPAVAPLLELTYETVGDWRGLIRVLSVMEQTADSVDAQVELQFRMAALYETHGEQSEYAFAHYGAAYGLAPEREDTMGHLLRLGEQMGNHPDLAELLAAHVEQVVEADRRREVHRIIAQMRRDRCGNAPGAIEQYRAVLELSDTDMPAIDALLGLYEDGQAWGDLVEMLRRKASLSEVDELRKELLLEAGRIGGTLLGSFATAIDVYEEVLIIDPQDWTALDALHKLYTQTENWPDLCRTLNRKIEFSEELASRKQIAMELAGVHESRAGDLEAAIETYRRILSWDPSDVTGLRALTTLFEKTEAWLDLLEALEQQIALVDEREQIDLSLRKATIWQEKLEDEEESIQVLSGVLAKDPSEFRAVDALEDIVRSGEQRERAFEVVSPYLEMHEHWTRTYQLLDILVGQREMAADRIEALHQMAGIAELRMEEAELAFACYGRALHDDLGHSPSMDAVERLAGAHGLWEQLTQLLQEGAAGSEDLEQRIGLHMRAAEVLKGQLGDMDRAIETYNAVLKEEPEHAAALESLDQLYQLTERWPELAGVLGVRVDICADVEEKVGLYFRLAELAEQRLSQADRACQCYREIFYLAPENPDAIENLERLAREGVQRVDIATMLEPVYADRGQWSKLHEMLQLRLPDTTDTIDRSELIRRLAEINLEHLGQKSEAIHWYGQAFQLDPADDGLLARLETLVAEESAWETFKDVLLPVAVNLTDSERKVELWHKAARVLEEELQQTEQAEFVYKLILNEQEDRIALGALDRLYAAQGQWEELYTVLEREIDVVDYDEERITLLLRLGALLRDRLGRNADAIDAYRRALDINDAHREALSSLAQLYRTGTQWSELVTTLRQQVDTSDAEEERLAHLREMAGVSEHHLHKAEDSLELWEEILSLRHDDLDAIRNVQRLHRASESHDDLVEALEREARILAEQDPVRRGELYRELGRLWEGPLDDPLNAQQAWERLLQVEENDHEALRALAKLHEDAGNYEALAGVLEQMVASGTFSEEEGFSQHVQRARLYTDTLPDPTRAIEAWCEVRNRAPEDVEAVEALERLYLDEAQWENASNILRIKAGLSSGEAAIQVWLDLGELFQFQLANWQEAAAAYHTLLGLQENHPEASERLESIYTEQEQWPDLAEVLESRAPFVEDPEDKRTLFVRLADINEVRLEEPGLALVYLQAAHQHALGDPDLLSSIERIAMQTEAYQDYLDQLVRARDAADDSEDQIDFGLRAARLLRDSMGQPDVAIPLFTEVLALDPEHEDALREQDGLLEQAEQWEPLVGILERRYELSSDEFERSQIGLRIGAVWAAKLEDVDRAIAAYQRVLDSGENDAPSIEALQHLYETNDRWEDLIRILDAKASSGLGDETQLRLRIGSIYESKLSDTAGAIQVYEDILAYDETQRHALERLRELYAGNNDWEQVIGVYERLLHTAEGDREQIDYCEALALLQQEVHQDAEVAADYFHRILTIDGNHEDALSALEELYAELEQWEDLIDIYRRRLEMVVDDEMAWVSFKTKSARVYHEKLSDPDNAIFAYQELIARVPSHRPSLDALEILYGETGMAEQVQEILQRKAEHAAGAGEKIQLNVRQAQILLDELSDSDGALEILTQALELDPGADAALVLLERVYQVRGEWEKVVSTLEQRLAYASSTNQVKAEIHVTIAEVYRDHLTDGVRAVEHFEHAMAEVPDAVSTAEKLAQLYVISEDWIRAEALLKLVVSRSEDTEMTEARRAELHYSLGLAMENCLNPEAAVAEYSKAQALVPEDLDVLKALGRLSYKQGQLDRAEDIYSAMVEQVGDSAGDEELVELYRTLGQIAFKRGQNDRARDYLEKTVSLQPNSTEALRSLIDLCEAQEYWAGAVDYARELRDLVDDPLEKFGLQLRLGDLLLNRLNEHDDAVEAYRAALDFQPESKAAHHKILKVFVEAKSYEDAVGILSRLVELETDAKKKAKYYGIIAEMYRENLDDASQAIEFYNQALDHDPSHLKFFVAIEEIVTQLRDWKTQERSYRHMLRRIQGDESQRNLQFKLAKGLAEIYRDRLQDNHKAAATFELAHQYRPRDAQVLQMLSQLYEAADSYDKALAVERKLLQIQPSDSVRYSTIKTLLFDSGDLDGAWVACSVLGFMGQATARDREFYQEHQQPGMLSGVTLPDTDIWTTSLLSRGEDILVGQILQVIYQGIGSQLVKHTARQLGLKKKNKVEISQREMFNHVLSTCAQVLGTNPIPEVYHSNKSAGLTLQEVVPPVMLIGDDMRQGRAEQELAFVLGKVLTYFHPLHVAATIAAPETLDVLVRASIKLFVADYDVAGLENDENFQSILVALNEMPVQLREGLARCVSEFQSRGHKVNMMRWLNHVERSANHAGLLMCNDPIIAARALKAESNRPIFRAPGRLSTAEKLADLAVYAVSEKYLALRKALDIGVGR